MDTEKEYKIVKIMIKMFYKKHQDQEITEDSTLTYVSTRLNNCVFKGNKGFCSGCPIHCYNKMMREHIRKIMRYSGPRMMFKHPLLTIAHLRGKSWKNIDTSKYEKSNKTR